MQKKHRDREDKEQKFDNVKKLKLEEEYFREVIRNQELFRRYKLRENVVKYKEVCNALFVECARSIKL